MNIEMTNSEWVHIRTGLLYLSGMTIEEVAYREGVSQQAIRQRLVKMRAERREVGPQLVGRTKYPVWQRNLAQRLVDYGLSIREVAHLLSMPVSSLFHLVRVNEKKVKSHNLTRGDGSYLKYYPVRRAYQYCRHAILATAKLDGASSEDIRQLAGLKSTGSVEVLINRIRREFTLPDGRRKKR